MPERDPLVTPRFVELGGKSYRLHFTAWAVAIAEQDLDFSVLPLNATQFWRQMGSVVNTMRLLYAGTRVTAPQLTFEKLGELVDKADFGEISSKVDEAFADFFPRLLPPVLRQAWEEHRQRVVEEMEALAASKAGSSSTTTPESPSGSPSESSGVAV